MAEESTKKVKQKAAGKLAEQPKIWPGPGNKLWKGKILKPGDVMD